MKKIVFLNSLKISLLYIGVLTATASLAQTQLDISFDQTQQEIDNFGASDAWSIDPTIKKWISENRESDIESLADLLFSTDNGIGLSAWRFNVGAGSAEQGSGSKIGDSKRRAELFVSSASGSVNTSKQSGQVRFLKEAYERGVTDFIAFSNSPPTWATENGLAHPGNGSGIGSTNLRSDQIDDYANFLVKVLQFLRGSSVGVPVNYISPINEPTWAWEGQSQEGNRYNVDDMKAVYENLHSALNSAGLGNKVSIDGGEVVEFTAALSDSYKQQFDGSTYSGGMNNKGYGLYRNYINEFLGDSDIREIIDNKISMHGYFSDAWEDRMGRLRDLTLENVQSVSPTAKIWMSEMAILGGAGNVRSFTGGSFDVADMDYALHVGKMIHRDMTRLNASGWHWWLGLTPYNYKDGLVKVNSSLDASSVQTSKVMWTLGNYSRFIRPGYMRIELPGIDNLNGLMASAYKAPDNSKVVIVAVNAGSSAASVELNIDGLPSGATMSNYSIYTTNASNDLRLTGTISPTSQYSIPAKSTVTFVSNVDTCSATAIKPYMQVNGGSWSGATSATIDSGTKIKFGPQPHDGAWQWSGCGTSGTSREQTVYPTSSCTAKAVYTNSCGAQTTQAFSVSVSSIETVAIQENVTGFCGVDGAIESNHTGFTGSGFSNTNNALGNGVNWSVSVPSTGSYTLLWRYANASADRPGQVVVNNATAVNSVSFPNTGSWATWGTVSATVTLKAGVNSIRLEGIGASSLGNIDRIDITGINPKAATCAD